MTKFIAIVVVAAFAFIFAFDTQIQFKHYKLWQEYQASVPGCTTPDMDHYANGCVRPSQLDAEMWNKPASGRTPGQIKSEWNAYNAEHGICHWRNWEQTSGGVNNLAVYYPCSLEAIKIAFAGT